MLKEKKRNYNIDFLRGIATLWIIVIHTAFWSGTIYLPKEFYNLTLLLDVPAFMYISGISFNFSNSIIKAIKGIINQWKKWCFFLVFFSLIGFVLYRNSFHFSSIINWIFYYFDSDSVLPVVSGSIWFSRMYIQVTLFCAIIICLNNYFVKEEKQKEQNLLIIISLLFLILGYSSLSKNHFILSSYTSLYSIIFLLGYVTYKYKINFKQLLVYCFINLLVLFTVFYLKGFNITNFQDLKFPPSIYYLNICLFSIFIFWYLKDNIKIKEKNPINYIGKNAIFFYYFQGISSSLIFYLYKYLVNRNIFIIFIILLTVNVILTTIGAILLEKIYNKIFVKERFSKIKNFIKPTQK